MRPFGVAELGVRHIIMQSLLSNGVWRYQSTLHPEHYDFMVIDSARRRIITFILSTTDPIRYAPMRSWFQQQEHGVIDASLKPRSGWRTHIYKEKEDTISWFYGDQWHPWTFISHIDAPTWLHERLRQAHEKMDLQENAEQGAAANP